MPKCGSSMRSKISKWIKDYSFLTTDGIVVFCKYCDKQVPCIKKFQIEQHLGTALHKDSALKPKQFQCVQTLLPNHTNSTSAASVFSEDLCKALVAAKIPWQSLNNPVLHGFLRQHCKQNIPDESTLRKNYLPKLYDSTIHNIRQIIANNCIWFAVDETTDCCGRYIANLVVGILSPTESGHMYLIACKALDVTNHSTIARFVNDSLGILWPEGIQYNNVQAMLSDSAAYMIKAGAALQVFYPRLVHNTCFIHAIHRVAEEVRVQFPVVNQVISSVKKVFLKAPLRISAYKQAFPHLPLPPQPIITRWGTWIEAALFYCENYAGIKQVVDAFNPEDASHIAAAQQVLNSEQLNRDLAIIQADYSTLPSSITKLSTQGILLTQAISHLQDVQYKLQHAAGQIGMRVKDKFIAVLERNPGYKLLAMISNYLNGQSLELPGNITYLIVPNFKYCPTTSVDVERTFSAYKMILTDKRQSLTADNLEKIIVSYCFMNYS